MEKSNYMAFLQEARQFIPQERIYPTNSVGWLGEQMPVSTASSRKS